MMANLEAEATGEIGVKRPADATEPSPEKKTKIDEEVRAVELSTPTSAKLNSPKILMLDYIKATKAGKSETPQSIEDGRKKAAKVLTLEDMKGVKTGKSDEPQAKEGDGEKTLKVLTLEEIKAKKAKGKLKAKPKVQAPGPVEPELIESKQVETEPIEPIPVESAPVIQPKKRAADTELPEPVKKLKASESEPNTLWKEAVIPQEDPELIQKITQQLVTSEGIEQITHDLQSLLQLFESTNPESLLIKDYPELFKLPLSAQIDWLYSKFF